MRTREEIEEQLRGLGFAVNMYAVGGSTTHILVSDSDGICVTIEESE